MKSVLKATAANNYPRHVPRTLSLSSDQLSCVMFAADAIPQVWRSRFLESVSDILMAGESIDDVAVAAAIDAVLHRVGMK